jgi:hypothetical protein
LSLKTREGWQEGLLSWNAHALSIFGHLGVDPTTGDPSHTGGGAIQTPLSILVLVYFIRDSPYKIY